MPFVTRRLPRVRPSQTFSGPGVEYCSNLTLLTAKYIDSSNIWPHDNITHTHLLPAPLTHAVSRSPNYLTGFLSLGTGNDLIEGQAKLLQAWNNTAGISGLIADDNTHAPVNVSLHCSQGRVAQAASAWHYSSMPQLASLPAAILS